MRVGETDPLTHPFCESISLNFTHVRTLKKSKKQRQANYLKEDKHAYRILLSLICIFLSFSDFSPSPSPFCNLYFPSPPPFFFSFQQQHTKPDRRRRWREIIRMGSSSSSKNTTDPPSTPPPSLLPSLPSTPHPLFYSLPTIHTPIPPSIRAPPQNTGRRVPCHHLRLSKRRAMRVALPPFLQHLVSPPL